MALVCVIGEGGREHALAWKLAQSPKVVTVLCNGVLTFQGWQSNSESTRKVCKPSNRY